MKEYVRQSIWKQDNLIVYLKNSDIAFLLLFSWLLPRRRTIVGIHDFIMHKGKNTSLYSFFITSYTENLIIFYSFLKLNKTNFYPNTLEKRHFI